MTVDLDKVFGMFRNGCAKLAEASRLQAEARELRSDAIRSGAAADSCDARACHTMADDDSARLKDEAVRHRAARAEALRKAKERDDRATGLALTGQRLKQRGEAAAKNAVAQILAEIESEAVAVAASY